MKKIISILSVITVCVFAVSKSACAADEPADDKCKTCWIAKTAKDGTACTKDADCETWKNANGAKEAKCVKVYYKDEQETRNKYCVATKCKDGYMAWVYEGKYTGICHAGTMCADMQKKYKNNGKLADCEGDWRANYVTGEIKPVAKGISAPEDAKAYDRCSCGGLGCGDNSCVWEGLYWFLCPDRKHRSEVEAKLDNVGLHSTDEDIRKKIKQQYYEQALKNCEENGWGTKSDDSAGEKSDMPTGGFYDSLSSGGDSGGNSGGSALVSGEQAKKLNKASDNLSKLFNDIDSDRSVWKNADGSFNATRLASDLTAGVVLGTVGGVVSGVLIKKSQVEKGFDALNCTVGGQKIADWGDEFRVGLRR